MDLSVSGGLLVHHEYKSAIADWLEQHVRRAVDECDPGSATLRFALASLVARKGDKDDALMLHRTVLAFDPTNTGALDVVKRLGGG